MSVAVWNTREPLVPEFAARWRERVSRTPQAHFGFDLEFIAWEAAHARHARLALADEDARRGLVIVSERDGRWVSGWPWRWQVGIEGMPGDDPVGLDRTQAEWLVDVTRRVVDGARLTVHLPVAPSRGVAGYPAGTTLVQPIAATDALRMAALGESRRRAVRRARKAGYVTRVADHDGDFHGYVGIHADTRIRHGRAPGSADDAGRAGEDWRRAGQPWMWHVVAARNGRIEAGTGWGLLPGGVLQARTGAASREALREGAPTLVDYDSMGLALALGYRWINWGGDTFYKRGIAGRDAVRVENHVWLSGPGLWGMVDRSEAWWRRAQNTARGWVRAWSGRNGGRGA